LDCVFFAGIGIGGELEGPELIVLWLDLGFCEDAISFVVAVVARECEAKNEYEEDDSFP
jgi:hypothetical protein